MRVLNGETNLKRKLINIHFTHKSNFAKNKMNHRKSSETALKCEFVVTYAFSGHSNKTVTDPFHLVKVFLCFCYQCLPMQ